MKHLSDLPIGMTGTIRTIHTDEPLRERLHSLGLIGGVEIVPVRNSPLGCPRVYRCMNTMVAIRNKTASQIEIL